MTINSLMSDLLADHDPCGLSLRMRGWKWNARPKIDSRGAFQVQLDNRRRITSLKIDTGWCPYDHEDGMRLWLRDTLDLELLWEVSR